MIKRTLAQIFEMIQIQETLHVDNLTLEIKGVSTDSRNLTPGQLFFPLIGERFNGHEFVQQAIERGASAVVWQSNQANPPSGIPVLIVDDVLISLQSLAHHYRRQLKLRVVAITGSNGKTTTKDMIADLLNTTFRVFKTPGNLNNHIGLPLTILQCDERVQVLVAEMGMSGRGEISLLSKLAEPDVAVITIIGESHIEQLGSRVAISEAKMEIVDGLASDGMMVYYGDEPLLEVLHERLPETVKKIRFGESSANDYIATDVFLEADGTTFRINHRKDPVLHLSLLGKHNVHNALAAIAVAEQMGIHPKAMAEPLARLKITGMRNEKIVTKRGVTIINDAYNASPTSTRAALHTLSSLQHCQIRIAVLGDMLELGDQSIAYHEQIGDELRVENITCLYTFGDHAKALAERARMYLPANHVKSNLSKHEIASDIATYADAQTAILVKGSRGMKLEEVVLELQRLLD